MGGGDRVEVKVKVMEVEVVREGIGLWVGVERGGERGMGVVGFGGGERFKV